MKVLRQVGDIKLNEGSLMAKGLFNVSNNDDVSFWFDKETADDLIQMSEDDFFDEARVKIEISNL